MDAANPFETPVTFRIHRAEYLVGFIVVTGLIVANWSNIRWIAFAGLFLYIDLIGYIPGAVAFHRSESKEISSIYYWLYNIMHSFITQAIVLGIWGLTIGWEAAMLAVPFHLFGDRALFGNFMKSLALPFEPHRAPAYDGLLSSLGLASKAEPAAAPAPVRPAEKGVRP